MDQRDYGYQAGSTGHDYIIWRFRIYGTAVRWFYASARMEIGLLRVYELFCRGKSVSILVGMAVAEEKRCCLFFDSVMARL